MLLHTPHTLTHSQTAQAPQKPSQDEQLEMVNASKLGFTEVVECLLSINPMLKDATDEVSKKWAPQPRLHAQSRQTTTAHALHPLLCAAPLTPLPRTYPLLTTKMTSNIKARHPCTRQFLPLFRIYWCHLLPIFTSQPASQISSLVFISFFCFPSLISFHFFSAAFPLATFFPFQERSHSTVVGQNHGNRQGTDSLRGSH